MMEVMAVSFVGFVKVAAFGKEGFAFTMKRGDDSLAQMPSFRHQVIELPYDFAFRHPSLRSG